MDGEELDAPRLHGATPDAVDLEVDGVRRRYRVRRGADGAVFVNTDEGQLDLTEAPRFPDRRRTPRSRGRWSRRCPAASSACWSRRARPSRRAQPLLIVEAMKMEHEIVAPTGGPLVELHVAEGAQVETGTVLAVIGDEA